MNEIDLQRQLDDLRRRLALLENTERPNQATDTTSNVTVNSLNVGSATGAASGGIRASGTIYAGPAAGTGATGYAGERHVLASAAIDQILNGSSFGTLLVHDGTTPATAIYVLNGGGHTTVEVSDPAAKFSITKGTATSINIYWDTTAYFIQNTNAGSHTVDLVFFGTP